MTFQHTTLHLIIKDITVEAVEEFAGNTDIEKYGLVRCDVQSSPIVDFELNVLTFAIDLNHIILEFPNHNTGCFRLNNRSYYSIEVI